MPINPNTLAERLLALRRQRGLSQEELAEQLGVSRQSVSKWEGAQSLPDLDRIADLCRVYGVSADYLLGIEPTLTPEPKPEPVKAPVSDAAEAPTPDTSADDAIDAYLSASKRRCLTVAAASACCVGTLVMLWQAAKSASLLLGGSNDGLWLILHLLLTAGCVIAAILLFPKSGTYLRPYRGMILRPGPDRILPSQVKLKRLRLAGVALCIISPILPINSFISFLSPVQYIPSFNSSGVTVRFTPLQSVFDSCSYGCAVLAAGAALIVYCGLRLRDCKPLVDNQVRKS
ncbi:MAG: helix-turn-helix transcriptional regulator [Clostridia bacterium]|nr:helix-turn-helix transcriptional regulator [Clostridia bacterium]